MRKQEEIYKTSKQYSLKIWTNFSKLWINLFNTMKHSIQDYKKMCSTCEMTRIIFGGRCCRCRKGQSIWKSKQEMGYDLFKCSFLYIYVSLQYMSFQKMEISERNYLISKIKELSLRRQKHENIIQKLISNQQTSAPSQNSQSNVKYMQMKHFPLNPIQRTDRSCSSHVSGLSCEVNIETYLKQKQDLMSSQQYQQNDEKKLYNCLKQIYGNDANFQIRPSSSQTKKILMVSQDSIDFTIVSNYLSSNQLWEQVFIFKQNGFYANISEQFCRFSNQTACLSKQSLIDKEKPLLVEERNNQSSEKDFCKENISKKTIFIGYLLLYRLLRKIRTGCGPQIFQSLFGYPYKIYNIHSTNEYFQFQNSIKIIKASNGLILGKSCLNNRLQQVQLAELCEKSHKQMTKKYRNMVITYTKQLTSKKMDVIHRRNHHSVLDMENLQEHEMEIFISFIPKTNASTYHQIQQNYPSNSSISHTIHQLNQPLPTYNRFCLIGEDGQIIKYSQNIHPSKQAINVKLAQKSLYKMYVSQVHELGNKSSSDLSQFSIVIQSQKSVNKIIMELKFNEDYNRMTEILINKYLKQFANIDQVQKQMVRISQIYPQSDLLIVRAKLNFMGLLVDFICVQDHVRKNAKKIWIQYEDKEVLCDKYYKENKKRVINTHPEIYQIYLSKKSAIKSCSGLKFSFSQIFM